MVPSTAFHHDNPEVRRVVHLGVPGPMQVDGTDGALLLGGTVYRWYHRVSWYHLVYLVPGKTKPVPHGNLRSHVLRRVAPPCVCKTLGSLEAAPAITAITHTNFLSNFSAFAIHHAGIPPHTWGSINHASYLGWTFFAQKPGQRSILCNFKRDFHKEQK